jgi:two-component system sensor histidine kinase DesK
MSAVGVAPTGGARRRSVRQWTYDRLRLGAGGTGHVAGVLALLGLTAYGLLVASVSLRTLDAPPPGAVLRLVGVVAWVLWFAAYVWSVVRVLRRRRHHRLTQGVAITGLVWALALFEVYGENFAAPAALSFSVMLLCLSGRVRGVITVVALVAYFMLTVQDIPDGLQIRNVEEFALSSLIFYAIPRLVIFARELDDTRSELAQLAVSEQRLRWARDLHDTLGHGLSVVVLKLELVERLSGKDIDRALGELRDARTLLRESIGEMQTVVAGMRDVSLQGEIANARTILNSAGVATTIEISPVELDERVAETLAWIVREGSTNVLRHSESSSCQIILRVEHGRAVLVLANDGPAIKVTRAPSGGHGIRGMRERLTVLGGRLTVKSEKDGGFVLEASVPLPGVPQPRPGASGGAASDQVAEPVVDPVVAEVDR